MAGMPLILKKRPKSPLSRRPPTMSVRGARIGTANAKSATSSLPVSMLKTFAW